MLVAACVGLDLLKSFDYADRAPARLVIGPSRVVTHGEVEVATLAFYKEIFNIFDAGAAFRAMNEAVDQLAEEPGAVDRGKSPFNALSAEILFHWVMSGYFEKFLSENELEKRTARITANVVSKRKQELGIDDGPDAIAKLRTIVRTYLTDNRARFRELHDRFFFADLHPENTTRFDVTFEDCWGTE